jgi:DNA invertase Pin-like site-specific DNA recombinase
LGQVAIYCRVSTDDQSCERQELDLRAFARRGGHRIAGVFKETASGAKNDRVERKKVMALAQARDIDAILVTELSRWGRSTQDLVQTLDDLHSYAAFGIMPRRLAFVQTGERRQRGMSA